MTQVHRASEVGKPPKRARNYKFDRSKMIFAYSVDYGKSYYLSYGASYQELWDNRIYMDIATIP